MKIVISQPMYWPWPGLFNQIKLVDIFVHYDDAMMSNGQSFIPRVQINLLNNKKNWMTVPLKKKNNLLINKVEISNTSGDWKRKHLTYLKQMVKNKPYEKETINLFNNILENHNNSLCEINIKSIEEVSRILGLKTKFIRSSQLSASGNSSEKLLNICNILGAKEYITGLGALNYLNEEIFFNSNINVKYMKYLISNYTEKLQFDPYVSCLELLSYKWNKGGQFLNSKTAKKEDLN